MMDLMNVAFIAREEGMFKSVQKIRKSKNNCLGLLAVM